MIYNTDEGIEPKDLNNDDNFRSNAIVTNTVSIVTSDKHKTDINRTELIELREFIFAEDSYISSDSEGSQIKVLTEKDNDSLEESLNKEETKIGAKDIKRMFINEITKKLNIKSMKSSSRASYIGSSNSLSNKITPPKPHHSNSELKDKFNKILPSIRNSKSNSKMNIRKQPTVFMDR